MSVDREWREALRGKRALVMGMARTGRAAASCLARLGARVVGTDLRGGAELPGLHGGLPAGVSLELGGHRGESFRRAQLLVVSPGVPADSPYIGIALAAGAEVISELELAYRLSPIPLVAVTGTNGKTTTTVLLGEVLRAAGFRVEVGGNIGRPLVGVVERAGGLDCVVAEVSSFQLEWAPTLRPRVGVITNVSPDHLDRHPDLAAYAALKARLLARQGGEDVKVLNADDPWTAPLLAGGPPSLPLGFSLREELEQGAFLRSVDRRSVGRRGSQIVVRPGPGRGELLPCRAEEVALRGVHNLENLLAAFAAGGALGADASALAAVARTFRGLPHRLEEVARLAGVSYVNDSKGTNVGATLRSIESFEEPLVLIAGGTDKGSSLEPLRRAVRERVRLLILLGEARERFRAFFEGEVPLQVVRDLEEAVLAAQGAARPGWVVLLSPACASFDMFRDYEERGERFRGAVERLAVRAAL
ncbi:MAG: UDP-N-acetylmuramoyl-L-alanine--D-glutamate ligase [Nitrospinota bacterium]